MASVSMPVLNLVLKGRWFNMVGNGKLEEYRDIKPYWERVFGDGRFIKIKGRTYLPAEVWVRFRWGYSPTAPWKMFQVRAVRIGEGNKKWGAEKGVSYYVIELGDLIGQGQ